MGKKRKAARRGRICVSGPLARTARLQAGQGPWSKRGGNPPRIHDRVGCKPLRCRCRTTGSGGGRLRVGGHTAQAAPQPTLPRDSPPAAVQDPPRTAAAPPRSTAGECPTWKSKLRKEMHSIVPAALGSAMKGRRGSRVPEWPPDSQTVLCGTTGPSLLKGGVLVSHRQWCGTTKAGRVTRPTPADFRRPDQIALPHRYFSRPWPRAAWPPRGNWGRGKEHPCDRRRRNTFYRAKHGAFRPAGFFLPGVAARHWSGAPRKCPDHEARSRRVRPPPHVTRSHWAPTMPIMAQRLRT